MQLPHDDIKDADINAVKKQGKHLKI